MLLANRNNSEKSSKVTGECALKLPATSTIMQTKAKTQSYILESYVLNSVKTSINYAKMKAENKLKSNLKRKNYLHIRNPALFSKSQYPKVIRNLTN